MKHGPLAIRPKLDPAIWVWIARMLRNCTAAHYAQNKIRMVPLAEYSRDVLRDPRAETGIANDERWPARSAPVSVKKVGKWISARGRPAGCLPTGCRRLVIAQRSLPTRCGSVQLHKPRPSGSRPISPDGDR